MITSEDKVSYLPRTLFAVGKRKLKFISNLLRRPKLIKLDGIILEVSKTFSQSMRQRLYSGSYEGREAVIVKEKIEPDDVVIELGGGLGFISCLCAKKIGSSKVYTYEANPELIPIIKRTHESNGVNPKVINAIVSLNAGEIRSFYLNEDFFNSSVFLIGNNRRQVQVITVDLNEEVAKIRPTFLIIDVEGAEYELLLGLDFQTIKKISLEYHREILGAEKIDKIRAHLTRSGFSVDSEISLRNVIFLERLREMEERDSSDE